MAISEAFSGASNVAASEWSVTANAAGVVQQQADGVYQLWCTIDDMVAGDVMRIRLYECVFAGSPNFQQLVEEWTLSGAQSEGAWCSDSFILLHGWDFTLTALSGTITVHWSVRKVA